MMHHPLHQHYQQYCSSLYSTMDMRDCEDTSDFSSMLYFPSVAPGNLLQLYDFTDNVCSVFPTKQYSPVSSDFGSIVDDQIFSDVTEYTVDRMQVTEDSCAIHLLSEYRSPEMMSVQSSVVLPMEDMELDNEITIPCLLKAYGEAIENEQTDLVEVILTRIKEKVSQTGSTVERVAYYLFQASDKQDKSRESFGAAFGAFYEILPHGRFVHLTANMAILESVPAGVQRIHIIDFDMGYGVQLASLIADIGEAFAVRITSIQCKGDCDSLRGSFQDTKGRLCEYAESLGQKLTVDEMNIEELGTLKHTGAGQEWLVFNCMVGLPHMGTRKSSKHVTEFLGIAKEAIRCKGGNSTRGIITLGEGDVVKEWTRSRNEWGSFFEECFSHFHALFESLESHIPSKLAEARVIMECLFLAPYVSYVPCTGRWEEIKEHSRRIRSLVGAQSWGLSEENFLQAKEIAKEGNGMYAVKLEGPNENVMSLSWKGIPLLKVSTWR